MLKMIEVSTNDAERIADMLEKLAHLQRIMDYVWRGNS